MLLLPSLPPSLLERRGRGRGVLDRDVFQVVGFVEVGEGGKEGGAGKGGEGGKGPQPTESLGEVVCKERRRG